MTPHVGGVTNTPNPARYDAGSVSGAFAWALARDVRVALHSKAELGVQLLFYVIVVSLFPLAASPSREVLGTLGPGVLWTAALLASLLSLPRLFASDYADGTLEQIALSPRPLPALVSGKIAAHWLTTGLPVTILAPLLGAQYALDGAVLLTLALLLGTPILSLLGAIGAALTLGTRGGGSLLALLVLPLYAPVLIFGAGAVDAVRAGLPRRSCRCSAPAGSSPWRSFRRELPYASRSTDAHQLVPLLVAGLVLSARGERVAAFGMLAALLAGIGVVVGLIVAPTDATQGDAYRIIFIHVPAAWMAMFIYLAMAGWSAARARVQRAVLGDDGAGARPDRRADGHVVALWTGAFWGWPTWGTYWAWDARMTSDADPALPLPRLHRAARAIEDPRRADRASALLALVGAVNVPDHLLLGAVVEHAAPGCVDQPHGAADHGVTMLAACSS